MQPLTPTLKRIILLLILTATQSGSRAQGWPADYEGVMLLGFFRPDLMG